MTNNTDELQSLQKDVIHQPKAAIGLDKPQQTKPLGEQSKAVHRQELMVLLMSLGVLTCGIGLGFPTVSLPQLTNPKESVNLDKSQASWFASISSITCPLGALLAALLMDRIGKKRIAMLVNVLAIASWAIMASAVQEDSQSVYVQLIISRCIIGITMGMGSSPTGIYGAEISLPKIRGRLISATAISVASGILLIYVLGYFIRNDWHLLAKILLAYHTACLILLIPVNETPSWLMSKGRANDAKSALLFFRGLDAGQTHPEVEAEYAVLQKTIQLRAGAKKTPFYKCLRLPEIYKPLMIILGLFCCQQFSGIFVVVAYAVQIATKAGVNIDPILCAIFIGIARTLTTFITGGTFEKYGRRQVGMFSATGMAICLFTLAATSWFPWLHIPYLPAVLIVLYIILSTLGMLPLPFFMNSELFPQKFRGTFAGLTGSFGFLMSFFVIKAYPYMRDSMGAGNVFALYGAMSLLTILFIYFCLPETKGKTLLEIEEYFRYGKKGVPKPELEEVFVNRKTDS